MKLSSDKKITGTIQSIGEESFVITDSDGQSVTVPFSEVTEIDQKRTSAAVKAAIAAGAAVGVIALLYGIWYAQGGG
jgi:hypothetical protein